MTEQIVNLDSPREKQMLLQTIRALTGTIRFTWCKNRPRRSDRQNRFLWPCFVQPFGDYLRGHGNKHFTDEMAHAVLKEMFLKVTEIDQETNRELTYTRSSTELNTAEFNEYLDNIAQFLAEECGFIVPEPDLYRERESAAA